MPTFFYATFPFKHGRHHYRRRPGSGGRWLSSFPQRGPNLFWRHDASNGWKNSTDNSAGGIFA